MDRRNRKTRIIQIDRIIRKNRNIRITRKARMTPEGPGRGQN